MAKITGPLMSMDASGSVAGTITFSKWKGRNYVRQTVTPANPQSPAQTAFRAMFGFLAAAWKLLGSTDQGSWEAGAQGKAISPFNEYSQFNQRRWTQFTSPQVNAVVTPGTGPCNGDLASATGGVRQIDVLTTTPTNPNDNWGIILHRDTVTGFTPSHNNVIAVREWDGVAPLHMIDSNLTPGTYFYRATVFDHQGIQTQTTTEVTATAS